MKRFLFIFVGIIVSVMGLAGCLARQTIKVDEHPAKASFITYSGGNGTSYDSAIVISGGKDYSVAVEAEHQWIAKLFGEKDKDWKVAEQTTVTENTKTYNMVQVEIVASQEKHFYYFDITRYAKKSQPPKPPDETR